MQLEKLDLLEKRLGRFVEQYAQLKEEKSLLQSRLDEQTARLKQLEAQAGQFREERESLRERLDRIMGMVEELEQLQEPDAGEAE